MDYMTPLGLHHLMATRPPLRARAVGRRRRRAPDWNSVYYHRADARGHRLRPHGHGQQRRRAIRAAGRRDASAIARRVPEKFLLWFHHVPWDHTHGLGPHAVGRARRPLHARRRAGAARCSKTWSGLVAVRRRGALRADARRSSASRRRKRAGGATPASPTSRRSRSGRSRRASRPPEHTLAEYEAHGVSLRAREIPATPPHRSRSDA